MRDRMRLFLIAVVVTTMVTPFAGATEQSEPVVISGEIAFDDCGISSGVSCAGDSTIRVVPATWKPGFADICATGSRFAEAGTTISTCSIQNGHDEAAVLAGASVSSDEGCSSAVIAWSSPADRFSYWIDATRLTVRMTRVTVDLTRRDAASWDAFFFIDGERPAFGGGKPTPVWLGWSSIATSVGSCEDGVSSLTFAGRGEIVFG